MTPKSSDRRLTSARDNRGLLDRILGSAQLAQVVPRLPPELLHRIVRHWGLEDCAELVALATPDQLSRVFDLDLWRTARPGLDEQFDAGRFGLWLEVLAEAGAEVAAEKLAAMDAALVTAGFAAHMRVFDCAAVAPYATTDGELVDAGGGVAGGLTSEVGGYVLVAKRAESWDAIVAVLAALEENHLGRFHRVMRGCRRLSDSAPDIDGLDELLDEPGQAMFDVAFDREQRREGQGYVSPAQARAFLHMSRQLAHDAAPPPVNAIARAYFRAVDSTSLDAAAAPLLLPSSSGGSPADDQVDAAAAVAEVLDILQREGIVVDQPRALLETPREQASRLSRVQALMLAVSERNPAAFAARSAELAYLANTLVAGCSIQARAFNAQEASDAAVAICNLGLENWPDRWPPQSPDFLVDRDLIAVFQLGWTVLHEEVGTYAAARLIEILRELRCGDREIQDGLDALRRELTRHARAGAPWRARDALDVIAILDMPAWAALLGLIAECPVLHAALTAVRIRGSARSARRPTSSFLNSGRSRRSTSSWTRCRKSWGGSWPFPCFCDLKPRRRPSQSPGNKP